jgi:hypothetical protein
VAAGGDGKGVVGDGVSFRDMVSRGDGDRQWDKGEDGGVFSGCVREAQADEGVVFVGVPGLVGGLGEVIVAGEGDEVCFGRVFGRKKGEESGSRNPGEKVEISSEAEARTWSPVADSTKVGPKRVRILLVGSTKAQRMVGSERVSARESGEVGLRAALAFLSFRTFIGPNDDQESSGGDGGSVDFLRLTKGSRGLG